MRYATDNLPNKVLVREYLTALPDEKAALAAEIDSTREKLNNDAEATVTANDTLIFCSGITSPSYDHRGLP